MFGKKKILVVWVSANQLTLLGGKLSAPESIVLPETVISNLEVLDQDALYALIKDWATKHPMSEVELFLIYGPDVYYETVLKDEEVGKDERESVIVRFLDLLPFEQVESRTYMDNEGTRIIAINEELDDTLKRGFALQGYETRGEVAAATLGQVASQGLNSQVLGYIEKNLDTLLRNRLVVPGLDPNEIRPPTKPKKKSSLPLLLGVFGVLLLALGLVIWRTYG